MRTLHRLLTAVAVTALTVASAPALPAQGAGGPNLAAGKATSASSSTDVYSSSNITDGNPATYWESANNAFPQWVQVDLGPATSIDQAVLRLPTGWGSRTQTLAVQGSLDGTGYATIVTSATYTFNPASGNAVTINFPATNTRFVRLNITANTGWPAGQLSELEVYGTATSTGNLAQGRTMTESSHSDVYAASRANDGNPATYWESANNAFPQWIQVDLAASVSVNRLVLKLPTSGWPTRTQTLSVQGSTNGSTFADIVGSAAYTFDPASGSTVTINVNATTTRYVRLNFTANTGWPAAQLGELEVYGPGTGDTQAPSAPTNLAYTEPTSGQIRLTWNASSDNVGVTNYDIYLNGNLLTSVPGTASSYTDNQPDSATVSYYVRARDAAGNQSGNSNTVTRSGHGGDTTAPTEPTNLTYTQPGSGQIRLAWGAATDNVGVTDYDIYANGTLRASVNGSTLSYTDSQPDTATVSYHVKAKDAASNISAASNTVTRVGSGGGANLAVGKPITGSANTYIYVPTNANDNDVTTYFEGAGFPSTLTVSLGANADVTSVVVKLNPDPSWATRTQNIQVLGREQSSDAFTTLAAAQDHTFNPSSANTVTIPVTGRVADVRLQIASNTGAPGGQVAEFQVIGTPAPNPDLQVTSLSWSPSAPVETDPVTVSATVANTGTAASGATEVNLYLGTAKVGTAAVAGLAAGASTTVSTGIGTRDAGSYQLTAKVDEANTVIELNDANNSFTSSTNLVVSPVQSSDLVAASVTWSPSTPSAGNAVTFSVAVKNQGTIASGSGSHGITLRIIDANNTTVATLSGAVAGTVAAGATATPVSLGTWTAVNGRYTVQVVLAVDPNELPVKQANNTSTTSLFVGRGANLPYDMYEAEDGTVGGGAQVVGPNRTIGDLAGEASGRKAVTLNSTGSYVQWTTRVPTNTLVVRFSIPDAAGGGGINTTLNIYVNGAFHKAIPLSSKYMWLYGAEASPGNSPGAGSPRHIYDEANILLDSSVPQGSTIRLQKDAANTSQYAIDFVNLEQVSPIVNPDPSRYVVPAGFSHQDLQNALDAVRMDTTGTKVGIYLPPGTYDTAQKLQVYGKPVQVLGAGVWYTRFQTPQGQENTDAGFAVQGTANGSSFKHLAFFGNYTSRIDGPGKVWGELMNVSNLTIDDVWVEHTVCAYWGVHNDNVTIKNSRFRNTFADAVNFTNGTTNVLVSNNEGRGNGDDAFALFSATDQGAAVGNNNNIFENLTATLTWRAAGIAVYGGANNTFRNLYIADTLTYAGITISSLDFGYPFVGFGTTPTRIENASIVRAGGHFWGAQTFPGIWLFAASKEFRGIRISDVDIVDPTYHGIMFQTKYPEQTPVTDTVLTNITISGAQRSGDAFDAKSGFGIWANELPESGQGPAVGSATFNNLTFRSNYQNIRNTTSTFTITVNP
ncbi:discoidin domain-containing protein [Micromonospora sp. NPDC047548]|uniref:discoidin domain-containing protein n=1 Tax=Micromonospora sp. NPDC047548 TaxID=3155624 RepID=UPI0033F00097